MPEKKFVSYFLRALIQLPYYKRLKLVPADQTFSSGEENLYDDANFLPRAFESIIKRCILRKMMAPAALP